MTIKGLNKLIKEKYPQAIDETWLSDFKDKRIFIDADNIIYHYIAAANKKVIQNTDVLVDEVDRSIVLNGFIRAMISLCMDFLNLDILPVLVFDGKPPEEKNKTRHKRIVKKEEIRNKITTSKEKLMEGVLTASPEDVNNYKKLLVQDTYITKEELAYFKMILNSLHLPIVEANCESEKLCSAFCIEGKGIAVYSQDSDCLAHGNHLTIRSIGPPVYREDTKLYDRKVEYIIIDRLLDHLELEYESFVDLCIAAGTDYNANVRNIGIGKMIKYIKTYQKIDNLPADKDWSILNHQTVRQIFLYQQSKDLSLNSRLDMPKEVPSSLRMILDSIDCLDLFTDLKKIYERFKDKQIIERPYMIDPRRKKCNFIILS